jgi:predicted transcriptional regulator
MALAHAHNARSLTQPALSKLTGIQQAEISRIESGAGNPTAATFLRFVDALGQKLTLVPTSC